MGKNTAITNTAIQYSISFSCFPRGKSIHSAWLLLLKLEGGWLESC